MFDQYCDCGSMCWLARLQFGLNAVEAYQPRGWGKDNVHNVPGPDSNRSN